MGESFQHNPGGKLKPKENQASNARNLDKGYRATNGRGRVFAWGIAHILTSPNASTDFSRC